MARCTNCGRDVDPVAVSDGSGACCSFCGALLGGTARLTSGAVINGFEILGEIGRGGMGVVYKARQLNLQRDVAFKVLADDLASDAEFVERFFREARAAGSLNHPNIVQVYDAGSTPDGIYYFVMELVTGDTLEMRVVKDGAIPPKESLRIAIRIADALHYAWESQRLTHGDIKPENIILNNAGSAKLADLGLAKWAHDEADSGGLMATPMYAPPEIIRGEARVEGFRSDMYSFGITLFHMLAGAPPFPDDDPDKVLDMHLEAPLPSITEYNEHISPAFVKVLDSLLEKDPYARPDSWEHVLKSLKKIHSPEMAGRVFHTHGHNVEDAEPLHDPSPETAPALANYIKLLAALAFVLLVVVGGVLARKYSWFTKHPTAAPSATTHLKNNGAEQAWLNLKPTLDDMDTATAVSALSQLSEKYGDDLPDEARAALEEKKQLAQEEERQAETLAKQREEFDVELQSLLADIENVDIEKQSDTTIPLLKKLARRVNKIMQMASQTPSLEIPQEKKEVIDKKYNLIIARLEKHKKELKRQAIEKAAQARRERLEEQARKRAAEEKERRTNLLECNLIDIYYQALADYQQQHLKSKLEELRTWGKNSSVIPLAYSERVSFINKNILPNASKLPSVLLAHNDDLTYKHMPGAFCKGKRAPLSQFKIKTLDDSGIKLFMKKNNVVIGQTVKWTSLTPKDLLLLADELLLKNNQITLTKKDINTILAFTLLRHPQDFDAIYNQAKKLSPNLADMWSIVKEDFLIAPREKEAIEKYSTMRSALNNGNIHPPLNAFFDLLASQSKTKTAFSKRYKDEFDRLLRDLAPRAPAVRAWCLLRQCETTSDIPEKFNTVMVLQARFANIRPLMGEEANAKINKIQKESLAYMIRKSGVKRVSDNRVPFYYWTREKQGAAWAYYKILLKSGKFRKKPQLLQLLRMAAAFDNGDWVTAIKDVNTESKRSSDSLRDSKLGLTWGPPIFFARGMVLQRQGNGRERKPLIDNFVSIIQKKHRPASMFLVAALAMEYAIATRQTSLFLDQCADCLPSIQDTPTSNAGLRLTLLRYLAILEDPKKSPDNIRKTGHAIAKKLNSAPKAMKGDALWVKTAADLAAGVDVAKPRIALVADAKLRFKDIDARIMSSAIGRRHAANQDNAYSDMDPYTSQTLEERKLLEAIRACLAPNIVASNLWRRVAILSMASCSSMDEMATSIEMAPPKKMWISTTPFYPSLLILKAGADVAAKNIPRKKALTNLKSYLNASPTTSAAEIRMLSAPTVQLVKDLFDNNQPEKAVIAGLFGIMTLEDNPKTRSSIVRELWDHYELLTWEERWLVLQIQNWRSQCLEY